MTTPCRLFATAYSIYLQLRYISVCLSCVRNQRTRLAVVRGPTYDGYVVCLQAVVGFSKVLFDINEKKSGNDN
jgi:hypothetical protein